jgi:hypothetical protein
MGCRGLSLWLRRVLIGLTVRIRGLLLLWNLDAWSLSISPSLTILSTTCRRGLLNVILLIVAILSAGHSGLVSVGGVDRAGRRRRLLSVCLLLLVRSLILWLGVGYLLLGRGGRLRRVMVSSRRRSRDLLRLLVASVRVRCRSLWMRPILSSSSVRNLPITSLPPSTISTIDSLPLSSVRLSRAVIRRRRGRLRVLGGHRGLGSGRIIGCTWSQRRLSRWSRLLCTRVVGVIPCFQLS